MNLYMNKQFPDTAFVSKGVLFDSLRVINAKIKADDISCIKIPMDEYPKVLYQKGTAFSTSPISQDKVDVIMQKYPEREEYHDVIMEKVKGQKGVYSCKLPVNLNVDGYLSADKDGNIEYINSPSFDNVRVGMARVKVIDENKKTVTGKMYTYHLPTEEVLINVYNTIKEQDSREPDIAPVYEYTSDTTSFAVIKTFNSTNIIYTVSSDGGEDIIVIDNTEAAYHINDQEALVFIRDVHNANNKRRVSYYTKQGVMTKIKKNEKVYKKFMQLAQMKQYSIGKTLRDKNGEKYRVVKATDTVKEQFISNNFDTPIGELIRKKLLNIIVLIPENQNMKPLYCIHIYGHENPLYEMMWSNIYEIAGKDVINTLQNIININIHTMKSIAD